MENNSHHYRKSNHILCNQGFSYTLTQHTKSFTPTNRKSRDLCRELLGPDVTFIVINLSKSCQKKRVEQRHGDRMGSDFPDTLNKIFDTFEPAGEDEAGAHNVMVNEDMSPDDVLEKVLEVIAKI